MSSDKVLATHQARRAMVYLRQSTLKQVHEHRESTRRQYGLQARALALGWTADQIDVIDEDLGQSGSSTQKRTGFQRLAEGVARGQVGGVFALEVSRLARCSADWHRLLDLCGLADVAIIDEQAVYTPRDYNDRLLLGLKGTMSEAEQYWMRLRLEGGRLNKARRGELYFHPPCGYEWDPATSRFRLDPDEQVQRAVRLVFERFRLDGSAYGVVRYFARHGLTMPAREAPARPLRWVRPRESVVLRILHNPIYAGAYAFGRSEERAGLVDGQLRLRRKKTVAKEAWKACLMDRHPAYLDWQEYMENQKKLDENRTARDVTGGPGAAREGHALLQGLTLCGVCGRQMGTHYRGAARRGQYQCRAPILGGDVCFQVAAEAIDEAVADLYLKTVQPPEIELGLSVLREVERQTEAVDRQWKLRLERARYEAGIAERRYKAVDPDNRVVARTLERDWEERLREIELVERERDEVRRREKIELADEERRQILSLSRDLPKVWHASTTTEAERKNLLRMLIKQVTLSPVDVPARRTRVQVLWQTGAVSELMVARRRPGEGQITAPEVVALIRQRLDEGQKDTEIAAELNQRGLPTGARGTWSVPAVRRVRYHHGIHRDSPKSRRPPNRREDGLYSLNGVAAHLGVRPGLVRIWVRNGWLRAAEGSGTGHAQWFRLDSEALERLQEAQRRSDVRRRPQETQV